MRSEAITYYTLQNVVGGFMAILTLRLAVDTSELEADMERIECGELFMPTVSAVGLLVDDKRVEDMPIYLEDL